MVLEALDNRPLAIRKANRQLPGGCILAQDRTRSRAWHSPRPVVQMRVDD